MQHFPIFLNLSDARVIVSGGKDAALAKLRLLFKTGAAIEVFARDAAGEIETWAEQGRLTLVPRSLRPKDIADAVLIYGADEHPDLDKSVELMARQAGVLVNIVDNLADSQFITPALVDRDPVTVAIGTEGTAPVLARAIKAELEDRLPTRLGDLAQAASHFRPQAEALPHGRARRDFWTEYFFQSGPAALARAGGETLDKVLQTQLETRLGGQNGTGSITAAIVASDDPELLPLKTRKLLHEADLVLHDADLAPEILELARREATFVSSPTDAERAINAAQAGEHALVLSATPPAMPFVARCRAAGLEPALIPGIAPITTPFALMETA